MDQETIRLIVSTLGVVVGSLTVAIAAVVTPIVVQSRQHKVEQARAESEQLRMAVIDFVDRLQREEHHDDEWEEPQSLLQANRERAFVALDTLLVGPDGEVSNWLRGFMGDRPEHEGKARVYFVHSALRDLISWQQGALEASQLVPFRYIENSQNGYKRKNIDDWQRYTAGDTGDKPPAKLSKREKRRRNI